MSGTGGFADDPALAGGTEEAGFAPEGMDPLFPDLEQPRKPGVQRFRKKPQIVQMISWDGSSEALEAVMGAGGQPAHVDALGRLHFWVVKSSALATISRGDWVALETDCSGVYPLAADVHAATYEPVTADPADSGVWADARQRATFQNQGVHEALRPVAPLLRTAGDLIAAVSVGIGRPGEWAAAAKTWREEYQVWLNAYVEGERIRLGIRDGER